MSEILSEQVLERIEDLCRQLGESLGIDPDSVPAYELRHKDFFPEVSVDAMQRILSGDGAALTQTIDHTLLKAEAQKEQVNLLCAEAIEHQFRAVCVNGGYIARASSLLVNTDVQLAAVVGFPLGQMTSEAKAFESKLAVEEGASEIDMVINIGWLKDGHFREVFDDISQVVRAAAVPVKVIIETALLTEDEKIIACLLSHFAGAAFVKTSTGFSTGGATVEDVALMRAVVGENLGVKASGGIKTYKDALAMLKAGANRIGTSSGIQIIG